MDAAQKAKLEEQQRQRLMVTQMINQKVAHSESLEKVVGELGRTVDRLAGEMATLNARINWLERRT